MKTYTLVYPFHSMPEHIRWAIVHGIACNTSIVRAYKRPCCIKKLRWKFIYKILDSLTSCCFRVKVSVVSDMDSMEQSLIEIIAIHYYKKWNSYLFLELMDIINNDFKLYCYEQDKN